MTSTSTRCPAAPRPDRRCAPGALQSARDEEMIQLARKCADPDRGERRSFVTTLKLTSTAGDTARRSPSVTSGGRHRQARQRTRVPGVAVAPEHRWPKPHRVGGQAKPGSVHRARPGGYCGGAWCLAQDEFNRLSSFGQAKARVVHAYCPTVCKRLRSICFGERSESTCRPRLLQALRCTLARPCLSANSNSFKVASLRV